MVAHDLLRFQSTCQAIFFALDLQEKAIVVKWTGGISKDQCKKFLIDRYGERCWGCNFSPCKKPDGSRDPRYFEVDHIRAQADKGSSELYNLAILCTPCNLRKGNRMTLEQLRQMNAERGDIYCAAVSDLINLDDRVLATIRKTIELAQRGETKKPLQEIFNIEMQASLTVTEPTIPEA